MTQIAEQLIYWGDSNDYIACPGHVDKAEFTDAADMRVAQDDPSVRPSELPSASGRAMHAYFRPLTRETFDREYARRPLLAMRGNVSEEDALAYNTARFEAMLSEGAVEPAAATDPDAQPWTMIATGA